MYWKYIVNFQSEKASSGDGANNSALLAEHNALSEKLSTQESRLREIEAEKVTLQQNVESLQTEKQHLETKVKVSNHAIEFNMNKILLNETVVHLNIRIDKS